MLTSAPPGLQGTGQAGGTPPAAPASTPKVIVPRARLDTAQPLRPKVRYSTPSTSVGLPGEWRGEAVGDRGRLEPVRRAELAQDVRDVDAGRLDADDERRGDLAVRVAAGDEGQDLRLAWRQAEDLLQALLPRRGTRPAAARDRAARVGRAARAPGAGAWLRSGPRRRGPPGAARPPRCGRRRRRRAPRPRASGSRPRGAGVRADPRLLPLLTTARAVPRRAHARTRPRPGRASRRRSA